MYKNVNKKKFNNNSIVYSSLEDKNKYDFVNDKKPLVYDSVSIDKKIRDIFNSCDYVYKADVKIVTDNDILTKRIVARNNNNLITIDGEYIPISVIRDIYK